MYKKAIIASTANALSIGAGMVRAQGVDSPWYGGIDLGRSRLGLGGGDFDNALAVGNASASRSGLLIGAGAMYDFNRNVFARAGWDRYAQIGSDDTGKGHADVYSIGVGYRF